VSMSHFFSEMDSSSLDMWFLSCPYCFNWATSFQKWIDGATVTGPTGPSGFQLGHFFSEMDSPQSGLFANRIS